MITKSVFLVPLIFIPAIAALGTQVVTYDNQKMLSLIKNLNGTVSEQLSLAAATWGKLRADYPRDVAKIEDFYDTLQLVMCQPERNITMGQQLQGYLIREQIREHLEIVNTTQIFQKALEAEEHELGKWQLAIGRHSQRLHCLFKSDMLRRIMAKVIRRLYTLEESGQLASFLYQLYMAGNRESYKSMVQAELMLYDRYKRGGKKSPEFSRYMAKLWQSLQLDEYYPGLDQATKQELLDAVIDLLGYI
ncbi:hypothetical protein KR009_003245 [Drosophila setifemur]|nr:hypothetical protein KR009_003245 [Drosophila setifemur]